MLLCEVVRYVARVTLIALIFKEIKTLCAAQPAEIRATRDKIRTFDTD